MEKYTLLKEIGRGSFSVVWLAEDMNGEQIVLKQYKAESLTSARREYLFLAAAGELNVPTAIDFYEDEAGVWLAMEYIEGDLLSDVEFQTSKGFTEWYYELVKQVINLHGLGICLNDIKPDNIMIRDGAPYLIDFGLATPNNYNDGIFRGSIAYSSPEKYLFKSCNFRGDIFALGILFLTLVKKQHPSEELAGENWQDIIADEKRWAKWLNETELPVELLGMLSWSADGRFDDLEMGKFAADYAKQEITPEISIMESYRFRFQKKAAKDIWKKKRLVVHPDDEPERIAEFAQLGREAQGEMVILIREYDLIQEPEALVSRLNLLLGLELNNLNDLLESNWENGLLLLMNLSGKAEIPYFEKLSENENVYYLEASKDVSAALVRKKDVYFYREMLGLPFDADDYEELSIASVRLSAKAEILVEIFPEKNDFLEFANWLNCYIPLGVAEIWDEDWAQLLAVGLRQGAIIVRGSNFITTAAVELAKEPKLANEYLVMAIAEQYFYIAGMINLRLGDHNKAREMFSRHYRVLIKQRYLVTAWQLLVEIEEFSKWEELGFQLQKGKAYLMRNMGDAKGSVEFYRKIEVISGSEEEAIVNADCAIAEQELGNYEAAAAAYQTALVYFRQAGKEKAEMRCLNNLAAVYYEQKDFNRCSAIYQEIIGLTEEKPEQAYARNYNLVAQINLADVFLHKGQWKRAHIYARNAVKAAQTLKLEAFRVQAEVIAVFTLFAQKDSEDMVRMVTGLMTEPTLSENPALAMELNSYFLPILQLLEPKRVEKLILENKSIVGGNVSDNVLITLFFAAWQSRNGVAQQKLYSMIKTPLLQKMADALYQGDKKLILKVLGELGRQDDSWLYINFGYQLMLANRQHDENIRRELDKILELYTFYPLQQGLMALERETPEHLNLLWDIVSMIHNKVEFEEIIGEVLRGVIKIANLDRALFYEFREGKLVAVLGVDAELQPLELDSVKVSETILLDTLEANEIRFLTDLQEGTTFDIHSSIFGLGLRTAVCYPLRFESAIQGVIYSDARSERVFSIEEKKLIESIMVQGRSAYEKVLHWEKLQEQQVTQLIMQNPEDGKELVGNSQKMQEVYRLIGLVARHNVNVLITGETGTGKELIARAIHRNYAPEKPFIPVNCAAIPDTLLESELFGYVKGAFTGADANKEGLISAARGGTLFLDEIGDMPVSLQAKLLRVIQERTLTPLGSHKTVDVDVRILAATNQDLEIGIDKGTFREDLYYRLKVIKIHIPPLRERKDDIPHLIQHFINKFNDRFHKEVKGITVQAMAFLQNRDFPGNVREVENEIERAMVLCPGDELTLEQFEKSSVRTEFSLYDNIPLNWEDYKEYRKRLATDIDQVYAKRLMKSARGNTTKASEMGGISRTQLYRLLGKKI